MNVPDRRQLSWGDCDLPPDLSRQIRISPRPLPEVGPIPSTFKADHGLAASPPEPDSPSAGGVAGTASGRVGRPSASQFDRRVFSMHARRDLLERLRLDAEGAAERAVLRDDQND